MDERLLELLELFEELGLWKGVQLIGSRASCSISPFGDPSFDSPRAGATLSMAPALRLSCLLDQSRRMLPADGRLFLALRIQRLVLAHDVLRFRIALDQ